MLWQPGISAPPGAATALAYLVEHTIRQEGTGIYIAVSVVGSLTATWPLIISTVVGMVVAAIIVMVARKITGRTAGPPITIETTYPDDHG